jgi:hypothetical protein
MQDYQILIHYLTQSQIVEVLQSWQANGYDDTTPEVTQLKQAIAALENGED